MAFDGPDAHEQRRRDLAIGPTGGGEPRHALLDRRQPPGPPASTDPSRARLVPSRSTSRAPSRSKISMASSSASRAGSFCLSRRRIEPRTTRVRPSSKGIGRSSWVSSATVSASNAAGKSPSVGREQRSGAGGHGERPRPLQGASPFLEPLDDLGRLVVRSELDQRHRVIGDEREHRGFPEARAAMELPCTLEMVASDRRVAQRQLERAQRGQREELGVHRAAPRGCLHRFPRVRSRRVHLARGGPRGAPTLPSLLACAGARTTALPRWSSDATQSPARNSIHPSSACRRPPASSSPEPTASSRSDVHIERLSSISPVLAKRMRDADARTSSDGARLRRRLELERLRHERSVDALPQPRPASRRAP